MLVSKTLDFRNSAQLTCSSFDCSFFIVILLLHFSSKVVTFRIDVIFSCVISCDIWVDVAFCGFCVNCYISRRNACLVTTHKHDPSEVIQQLLIKYSANF